MLRYIIGGSQTENKVYSFFHHNFHFPWLAVSTGALHTNTFQGIYYLTTQSKFIYSFQDWASLVPLPYSRAMTSEQTLIVRITHLAWKILATLYRIATSRAHKREIYFEH